MSFHHLMIFLARIIILSDKHEICGRANFMGPLQKVLLKNVKVIEKAKTFDNLFNLIERLVLDINGIGELYVYDTSLRIGAKLGLLPTKVYLHRGTRKGAKNLNLSIGIKGNTKSIEVLSLPPEFQLIEPHEIEDVLCIFKDDFVKTDVDITLETTML
jgi:hypothetical protein